MTRAAPQDRERLADFIAARIDALDLRGGLAACQTLNTAYPAYAHGWYLASFLMRKVGNHADALRAIDRAIELEPSDRHRLHRARVLLEGGDPAAARTAIAMLADRRFDDTMLLDDHGDLLYQLGDHRAALAQYSRAVELSPLDARQHLNRAAMLRYLGDIEGAEAEFNAVIDLAPQEYEAYYTRAHLRRQTREHNHIEQIKAILAATSATVGRVQLCCALAKELEDVGEFDAAFACLKQGADLKRQHMQYDVSTDVAIMGEIGKVYRGDVLNQPALSDQGGEAIFVIGLPRTGTTLVERILASHSGVRSSGELNVFSLELVRMVRDSPGGAPASRLEFVARTASLDFRALGETYLKNTLPFRDPERRFIDKLPFNYLYAGLIHRALPRAKIVSLERHPMDSCYSMYTQLFRDAYPFSYDLDDLGRYYIAYRELMDHWRRVMPGVIHIVRYEDLVADLGGEARRLLEYCGLTWEEGCLRFHENPEASTTASALQVRQPIYSHSVGRWRKFARQLEPLRARLAAAGIETD